jgi:hypothetical protein
MSSDKSFYFGNAALDQVGGSGWFIGQFIPAASGSRHQTAVEVKWGIHPDGDKRTSPWAQGYATTIAILVRGTLRVEFYTGPTPQQVTMQKEGDYVIYGPEVVHSWEAIGETIVVTLRFPSVEVKKPVASASAEVAP